MELDPEARRLLEVTRAARTPNASDKLRVERLLSRSLGLAALSVATGASSTAVAKSLPAALTGKWVLGFAVPALVVVSAASYFHARAPQKSESRLDQQALSVPSVPSVPAVRAPDAPPAPVAEAPRGAAEAEIPAAEPTEPPRARRSAPAEQSKKSETLDAELDLLHDAQAKWRNRDPNAALALLATHRQRYPKSVLGLEREALRVLSLCAAGRTAEARAVARRSFKNAPRSPLRASVEESCAKP